VAALREGKPIHLQELPIIVAGDERIANMQAIPLDPTHLCIMVEDITDRKRVQLAQQELVIKEETIRAQQLSLAELSTPIIPITDHVMVMPLIGAVDSHRAQQVLSTLLEGIVATRATVAILDITGVPVVDTQVANALIHAAQSVRLLGAQVILTGIRPEVAQTLVGLGVSLGDIRTLSTLQMGIAYATAA
jgi:rsbT co-antagonist protein RsbR